MTIDELVLNYPHLYHMAEAGTWPSIRQWGLLSTTALLDLFEVGGDLREQLEKCHRPKSVTIQHPRFGHAVVRDQKPMNDQGLLRALNDSGVTPRQWYPFLNKRTFFWLTRGRLLRLLGGREYRHRTHTVITVRTSSLVAQHEDRIMLSTLNSGCTKPMPHPRSFRSFMPISDYPFRERRRTRPLDGAVAELTVEYAVPDIVRHVVRVEHVRGSVVTEAVYP